jgi:2-iminobutanoate/2-iminopropanoate deaminase
MPSFQARSHFPCRKLWYPISSCITCFRRTGSRRAIELTGPVAAFFLAPRFRPSREAEVPRKKTIVEPSWEAKYSYSPAVITEGGRIVWLAGHVGFLDDAGASLAGNFDAQTRQAFKKLEKTLQRAGGILKDIVWMMVSISDGRYSQHFTEIRKEIYGGEFPASTLLTAAAFAVPDIMVEITAIAVVDA